MNPNLANENATKDDAEMAIVFLVELKRVPMKHSWLEVADRSAATLLPIIRQHIKQGGTTVTSDE